MSFIIFLLSTEASTKLHEMKSNSSNPVLSNSDVQEQESRPGSASSSRLGNQDSLSQLPLRKQKVPPILKSELSETVIKSKPVTRQKLDKKNEINSLENDKVIKSTSEQTIKSKSKPLKVDKQPSVEIVQQTPTRPIQKRSTHEIEKVKLGNLIKKIIYFLY